MKTRDLVAALLVLLLHLLDERLVNVRDNTAAGDRGLDERVELLVATDGELQVARRDALDLEVLGGITGQLEDFGTKVLKDGGAVDSGSGTDSVVGGDTALQVTVNTTDGELKSGLGRTGHRGLAGSLGLSLTSLRFSSLGFASFSGLKEKRRGDNETW